MRKFLLLLVLSWGPGVLLALSPGAIGDEQAPGSYLNVTNDTTNIYFVTSTILSWSNYVPTSGTVEVWQVRSSFSNLIFQQTFTNVRCISIFWPSPVYLGRNDGYRYKNGTTNQMKSLTGLTTR